MYRLFFNSKDKRDDRITISDKVLIHHLKDVLRLEAGDELAACDEKGNEYFSVIEELNPLVLSLKIKKTNLAVIKKTSITVACAIPKNAKFDDIVDKLTQLGVDKIIPLVTDRVIVKLAEYKAKNRLSRWEKIAASASVQSQRKDIPVIAPVTKIWDLLKDVGDYDLKLIPALIGERELLRVVLDSSVASLPQNDESHTNIFILIGPEGDFTPEEVRKAVSAGFLPVSLGDSVLRVDTAAIAVVSFIRLFQTC